MGDSLRKNAYQVLGLECSVGQKEITKRSKEILSRLKIDDLPEYEPDLNIFTNYRTEDTVKEAVHRLSRPRTKIEDYFFWFQITDEGISDGLKLVRDRKYDQAVELWKSKCGENGSKSLIYRKNLALLYSILLAGQRGSGYLKDCLDLWEELLPSDKFWGTFQNVYKADDEVGTTDQVFQDFREKVIGKLSDMFAEISDTNGDKSIYAEYTKRFSITGQKIEQEVLAPIYVKVNELSERLESLNVSDDGVLDNDEKKQIEELINGLRAEFKKLSDLALEEDGKTKAMRDRAAKAIRTVTLDIYNNIGEENESVALMDVALEICGTEGQRNKIKRDINIIRKNIKDSEVVQPVENAINQQDFKTALELIIKDSTIHKNDPDLVGYYENRKQLCITAVATDSYLQGKSSFDEGEWQEAKVKFDEAIKLIENDIELYDFNSEGVKEITQEVQEVVGIINFDNFDQLDGYREKLINQTKEAFEGALEETVLIILIDSHLYSGLCEFLKGSEQAQEKAAPIAKLMEEEKYALALEKIAIARGECKDDKALLFLYNRYEKNCVTSIAGVKYREAMDLFGKSKYAKAEPLFDEVAKLLTKHLDLFNFNEEVVNDKIKQIQEIIPEINGDNLDQVDTYRAKWVDAFAPKEDEEDKGLEGMILIFLWDSYLYAGLSKSLPSIIRKKKTSDWIGQIIVWALILGAIAIFGK